MGARGDGKGLKSGKAKHTRLVRAGSQAEEGCTPPNLFHSSRSNTGDNPTKRIRCMGAEGITPERARRVKGDLNCRRAVCAHEGDTDQMRW